MNEYLKQKNEENSREGITCQCFISVILTKYITVEFYIHAAFTVDIH